MSVVTKYLFMIVFIITLSGCSTSKYNVTVPDNLDPKFEKIVAERVKEVEKTQSRKMNPKVLIEQQRTLTEPKPEPEVVTETFTNSEVITKDSVALESKYNTIFFISVIQSIVCLVFSIYLLRKNKL